MTNSTYKKISLGITAIFITGFVFILANFWERLAFPTDYRMFDDDGNENLNPGEPIAQTFVARNSNLTQINILMSKLEKILPGDTLTVTLRDADCREIIRTAKHSWPEHSPKQFDRWTFEPITDSRDQTYCLHILYEAPEKRKSRPAIAKEKETGDSADFFTNLATGKISREQTLIFRPAYAEDSVGATLVELDRRIGAYKADVLKGSWLYVIFSSFLAVTFSLTLIFLLREEKK